MTKYVDSECSLFYTSSGKVIDRAEFENSDGAFIDGGNYGSAYRYGNDKVVKFVESPGSDEQYENMSNIKNLSLPNFYKIYEVLSCQSDGIKTFGGTIAQYYPKEDVDIFLQPSDFLLDSFNALCRSMEVLGTNHFFAFDLNNRNSILNSNGIFVIDADLYQRMATNLAWKIAAKNVFKLKSSVFYDLLLSNFFRHHSDELGDLKSSDVSNMLYDLMNLDDFADSTVFNKTLAKHRYPIDYIRSRK